MAKGGNGKGGGGGGKPGGDTDSLQWRGSRGDDILSIVDDGSENGTDAFTVSEFLSGSFDARRGNDILDFSGLSSNGISINLRFGDVSFDQGYLGFPLDLKLPSSTFATADFVGFENFIGTSGNDSVTGSVLGYQIVDGGPGDDWVQVIGGGVVIGGEGSDHVGGYAEVIYVGGTWDHTYSRQDGDGATDYFHTNGVILDFELPDGSFDGDKLVIGGLVGSGDEAALDWLVNTLFVETTWIDPDGVAHQAVALPTIDGQGSLFTVVGISLEEANTLIQPNLQVHLGTVEAGFMLTGTSGDDWLELLDDADQVLFELDGGNDTLLYGEFADPTNDTLYFEGTVPDSWSHGQTNGVDTWTADYNGQTITIIGLDQAGFDSLTMATLPGA